MDFTEAVALAKAGEERGFGYLYANTQESKYFLALKYMKNEEMAKDVMQEAYIKAFSHLEQLKEPEKFSTWFGKIVVNTAINKLKKNRREETIFFSDYINEDGECYEYDPEDENIEYQPEISYTKKETQEFVRLLLDELPYEQRLCILMFHLEGASIREIADTMNCSENTVKSRLNYGRKNLSIKVGQLKEKGYQLYNVAPLPLLLILLRSEARAMEESGELAVAGRQIEKAVFDQWLRVIQNPIQNPTDGINTVAKSRLLQTTAGKIATVAVVSICILGGVAYYKSTQPKSTNVQPKTTEASIQKTNVPISTTVASIKLSESPEAETTTIKDIYTEVLQSVQNQEAGYAFSEPNEYIRDYINQYYADDAHMKKYLEGEYYYSVVDLNKDGIKDLLVGKLCLLDDVFDGKDVRIFSCEKTAKGYQLKKIEGEAIGQVFHIAADGNGIYYQWFSSSDWKCSVQRVTIKDEKLVESTELEDLQEQQIKKFEDANPAIKWSDISDLDGLNGL
ncbi:MAG: RNA polymerase sigma factor [Lachnospiraceae bacterium]|nr:RNA polymerase sigma factor [Lachnospiraceae bacterium]